MAQNVVTYSLHFNRDAGGGSYSPRSADVHALTIQVDDQGGSDAFSDFIDEEPVPRSGWWNSSNQRGPLLSFNGVATSGNARCAVSFTAADTFVNVNGVATTNGSAGPIRYGDLVAAAAIYSREAPIPRILLSNTALTDIRTALGGGNVDDLRGEWTYAYQSGTTYQDEANISVVEEFPPDSVNDGTVGLQKLLRECQQGSSAGVVLGTQSNGTVVRVNQCQVAGLAPENAIYIRPEDIGTDAGQIPTSVAQNTGDRFRFHPSVFVTRGEYVSSAIRQTSDSIAVNITNAGQPIRIVSVTSAITSSNWLVRVDGRCILIKVQHPENSDYRRPRDIWNNVIVPALQSSQSATQPQLFSRVNSVDDTVNTIFSRLKYAEYWRCLPLPGTTVPQTETVPPAV